MKLLIFFTLILFSISCSKKNIFHFPVKDIICYNKGDKYGLSKTPIFFNSLSSQVYSINKGVVSKISSPSKLDSLNDEVRHNVTIKNLKYSITYYKLANVLLKVNDTVLVGQHIGNKTSNPYTGVMLDMRNVRNGKDIGHIKYFTCDSIPRCRDLKK